MIRNLLSIVIMGTLLLFSCTNNENQKELIWADEFSYEGVPDPGKWAYEKGYIRNRELQYYTDSLENVKVSGGYCIITAKLEGKDSITSGSINTLHNQDFLYGRIEIRAKIPSALGTWPAIWMLGTNRDSIRWPACGEIDIMEHVGYDPYRVHANVHMAAYNHRLGNGKGNSILVEDPWADFHTYALNWTEEKLDFFFDDSLYFTYENDMLGDHDTWPFDIPHYLLLNLAYGGAWGGLKGVDTTLLPVDFIIDYVRYYR